MKNNDDNIGDDGDDDDDILTSSQSKWIFDTLVESFLFFFKGKEVHLLNNSNI